MKVISSIFLLLILAIALTGSGVTSAAYSTIENAGSAVTQRPIMNFVSGCTPVDNSGANRTDVTCSGGGSSLAITVNGGSSNTPTTLNIAQGTGCTITTTGTTTQTVTFACGGSSGAIVHHQYYMGSAANTSGSVRMMDVNGPDASFLSAVPFGTIGNFGSGGGGTAGVIIFLPSSWSSAAGITVTADASPSTNDTGNFSLKPEYFCIPNGYDLGASPSYTAGSPVTVAAPGGSGTGFYRESIAMTLATPSCSAGNSMFIAVTRPAGDTYAHNVILYGIDIGLTY